jgi:hypothetical protein
VCGSSKTDLWVSTGFRYIPDKSPNGRWTTSIEAHYKNFSLGVDYRPLTENIGPVGSAKLWNEGDWYPSVVLGTGPDQFNGVDSQAYFATASKSIKLGQGFSIAPFVGVGYIQELDDINLIGGVVLRKGNFSSQVFNNGYATHFVMSIDFLDHHTVSFVLWGMEQAGFSYTLRF